MDLSLRLILIIFNHILYIKDKFLILWKNIEFKILLNFKKVT